MNIVPLKRKKLIVKYLRYRIEETFLPSINVKSFLRYMYEETISDDNTCIIFTMSIEDALFTYAFQDLKEYDPEHPDEYDYDHNLIVEIARRILQEG